jgi:hypothetical protein
LAAKTPQATLDGALREEHALNILLEYAQRIMLIARHADVARLGRWQESAARALNRFMASS